MPTTCLGIRSSGTARTLKGLLPGAGGSQGCIPPAVSGDLHVQGWHCSGTVRRPGAPHRGREAGRVGAGAAEARQAQGPARAACCQRTELPGMRGGGGGSGQRAGPVHFRRPLSKSPEGEVAGAAPAVSPEDDHGFPSRLAMTGG